jgi:hypothetical protein
MMSLWHAFRDRLIDRGRHWWKQWSSWLAFLWGLIVMVFWNDPSWISSIVASLPPELRAVMSPVVLGVVSGLPIILKLLKQRKLEECKEQANDQKG